MNSKLRVSKEVVEITERLIHLAIEVDEYWRRTAPLHELEEVDVKELLKLLDEIEKSASRLKEILSVKP